MHHASRQLPDRGELLALREALQRLAPRRHVLADRDDVRDVLIVQPHRNLRDAIVTGFAGGLRIGLHLLDLARREHAIVLELQQFAWLAIEHVEDLATEGFLARDTLRARLALAIPGADAIGAVDHVQTNGQRVDDPCREVALELELACSQRDFRGEVLLQRGRGEHRGEHLSDNDQDVVRHALIAALGDDHLETAESFIVVNQGQAKQRAAGHPFPVWACSHPFRN